MVFIGFKKALTLSIMTFSAKTRALRCLAKEIVLVSVSSLLQKTVLQSGWVDSEIGDVEVGVPKGPYLGPLLLLISHVLPRVQ